MNEAKKMIESQTQALSKMNQRQMSENDEDIKYKGNNTLYTWLESQDLMTNLTTRHFDKAMKRNKLYWSASANQNSVSKSNKIWKVSFICILNFIKIILPNGAKIRFTHYNVKNKNSRVTYSFKCLLEQIIEERPNIVLFMTPDIDKIKQNQIVLESINKK